MAGFKEYQMLFQLNASLGSNYSSTFTSGGKAVTDLQNKIESLNRTQSDISAYQKQQTAVENCKAKMELYKTQLDNLKNATASNSVEEAKLANEIAAKEAQLQKASTAYDTANAKLSDMGQKLREAGVDTSNLSGEQARLAQEAQNAAQEQQALATESDNMGAKFKAAMEGAAAAVEAAGLIAGLKKIYDALADCSSAAASFETAMAGVKRTVGGDDTFINNLGESFKEMSTTMPITAKELANIATTAGQLGIPQEKVELFTEVMAQLATTTDLTADNAATMLAQFSNITGVDDYERLGSTVAQLGDATATTASKVVDMSQGMAAAASVAGLSATDILGISAAVGSLGIEAQAGSTAMSTLISRLYKAVETGDGLEAFASVANMSAEEFAAAWGTDAAGALTAFINGLNDTERNGRSAIVVLDDLGITNVRQTKAILGLAEAGSLLGDTIASANEAWESNSALTEKASVMYSTTEAKLTMMQNAANNVKVAIGDALNPALSAAAEAATGLLQPLAEFIEQNPALVQGVTAFVGVLATAAIGIAGYTAATKLAAAASTLFAGAIPGVGIILAVAAGIGVLVAAVSALTGPTQTTAEKMESLNSEYDSLMTEIGKDQEIIDLCERYRELHEKLSDTTLSAEELKAVEAELAATGEALIAASDGRITSLETETEALNKQLQVEENLAKARQAQTRTEARENLKEQAKVYREACAEYEKAMENLSEAQAKMDDLTSVQDVAKRLTSAYKEIKEAMEGDGSSWDTERIVQLRTEFENLYNALTGEDFEFTMFEQMSDAMYTLTSDTDAFVEKFDAAVIQAQKDMDEAGSSAESASAVMQEYIQNAIDAVTTGGMTTDQVRKMLEEDFAAYADGAELVDAAMAQVEEAVTSMAATADDASGSVEELNESIEDIDEAKETAQAAISEINAKLEELNEEYNKAYEAAYNSIDGQIGLFDEMSYEIDTSVGDMIAALQSQAAYMDEYATNLQEAARRGVDEGLIKALSDGSTESAAYLAAIVASGDDAIAALNEAFQGVQEGKDNFAQTVAEMETDFSEKSAAMQQEAQSLEDSINGLDVTEGGENIGNTLVAGMESTKEDVLAAAEELKNASEPGGVDASTTGSGIGSSLIAGIKSKIAEVKAAAAELAAAAAAGSGGTTTGAGGGTSASVNVNMAYASGTESAKRGLALVGEEGPELMWMNGGEKIATAEETARIARQATVDASPLNAETRNAGNTVYKIEVKPEYNFSGTNMSEEDLQKIMNQNTKSLRIEVERILDDIQSDKVRSVYV